MSRHPAPEQALAPGTLASQYLASDPLEYVVEITYRTDVRPDARVIADLYRRAALRRPVDDMDRIRRMYEGSAVVVSAWDGSRLAGMLRGWTDGAYDGYVCDLAVDPDYQRSGIGRELLRRATERSPDVQWVLRASRLAAEYYSHLGWERIENGWYWPRDAS